MSIEKISGFNHNNTDKITDSQTLKKNQGVKGEFDISKEGVNLKNVDKVEISSEVKKLQETLSNLKSELKSVPDVREEKLKDVKARIESGFYDKEENIEKIANSIRKAGLRPLGT
jgi:anti-sigma28 factor (negative regulator of flagellin synthesis)